MYLLSAQDIIGKLIQPLCWMLVHSLWQGLLLAGITGLIIVATRKRSSALRYNLITSALVVFIAGISLTLSIELHRAFAEKATLAPSAESFSPAVFSINNISTSAIGHSSFMESVAGFFNHYAVEIVFIWFLVIGIKMAQMMAGIYSIRQIKKRKVASVGSYWSLRVQQLSAQLGIKQPVQFLQSGIVKVPMVIGYLKPVIFFPVGALASLSPADVEAILMHELAHIRRKDYLVNMLQHVVEILFFFNPAVLWVSAVIKTERENCCDDIALAQTNNKHGYINALVSFQEFDQSQPRYATALTGRKDQLLQRVKRIVNNNNKSLNNMEKIFLIVCFLLTGTLTLVYSQSSKEKANPFTVTEKKEVTETTEQTETSVNKTTMEKYPPADTPKISKLMAEKQFQEKLLAEQKALSMSQDSMRSDLEKKKVAEAKTGFDQRQKQLDEKSAELDEKRKQLDEKMKQLDEKSKQADEKKQQQEKTITKSESNVSMHRIADNNKYVTVSGLSYNVNTNITPNVNTNVNTNINPKDIDIKELTDNVITDLKTNHIISSETNLSYQLTNTQLVVNNVIQPATIHSAFKTKYIRNDNWELMYNWKVKAN